MGYNTVQNAIDYYIGFIDKVAKETNAVMPPRVMFTKCNFVAKYDMKLCVQLIKHPQTGKVTTLRFFLGGRKLEGDQFINLGLISYEDYLSLESEFEEALNEYRRVNFSKISRKQRHMNDDGRRARFS